MGVPDPLSADEVHLAAIHAVLRNTRAMEHGRADKTANEERFTWDREIQAACAELAYCKWRGQYWSGLTEIGARDSSGGADVRWTELEGRGGLLVYPKDRGCIVLMEGFAPNFQPVGWLDVDKDGARRPEWIFNAERAIYLVPRRELNPFRRASV